MNILVQRYFRRSRAVEDLAEEWQIAHRNAMWARDVDELVCECLELGKLAKHVWSSLTDLLFDSKINDIDAVGDKLRMAIARTKHALGLVKNGIAEAELQGYAIERANDFRDAEKAVNAMADDFEKTWPTANKKMAEDALAAYRKGEYMDSRELLGNARGQST